MSQKRVLVVDDEPFIMRSLTFVLKRAGFDVLEAHDGEEAVEVLHREHPDLVFLDVMMPKKNGYEVCQRLRKREWGMQMVMIAVTGWGQDEDRRRSRDAGFNYHLTKPVMFQDLMRVLSELGDSTVWV